jgi:CRISPR-associated protein Cmr2
MQYEYSATQDSWLQEAMFGKNKKQYWQNHYEKIGSDLNLSQFEFIPNSSNDALKHLPPLSFMLRVPFKLQKPYLSKDDRTFHILDNPVRKDKVFQTPMVASTSWKGALRAALWQIDSEKYKKDNKQIIRLFGDAHDDEKGQSGQLYFYPTFFDKIGLEVINPHDRKKGTSKRGPIYLECVPKDATGELVILYVPFGKVEESQVIEDLKLVVQGVKEMLTIYGFGAKTSSGFGIVEDKLDSQGELAIRADSLKQSAEFPTREEYEASRVSQSKPYSDKMYQIEKNKAERDAGKLRKKSFDKLSDFGDRAQEIVQNLSNSQ